MAIDPPLLSSVHELRSVEEFDGWRHSWDPLCRDGFHQEPFFGFEWVRAFAKFLLPSQTRLLLCGVELGRETVAALLLQRCRSFFRGIPARTLRGTSNVHSCRYDLVHRAGAREAAVKGVWSSLRKIDDWDVVELLDVPEGGAFADVLKIAAQEGFITTTWPTLESPYLELAHPSVGEEIFPNSQKDFRRRLRSKLRQLQSLGQVRFERVDRYDAGVFEEFLALEASGWKGKRGTAISQHPHLVAFYRQVAIVDDAPGRSCMYVLRLDEKPIAMHFGLDNGKGYFAPKVAYNEELKKHSPGQLLVRHVIDDLRERGVSRYDFLGPRADWKMVWTSKVRCHHNLYIFRPSLRGRLLYAAAMRAAAFARKMKRRIVQARS